MYLALVQYPPAAFTVGGDSLMIGRKSSTVPAEQCTAPALHIDRWHVEGGQVVCALCRPLASQEGIAGGWSDIASVLTGVQLFQEMIRRATRQEGAQE